MAAPTNLYVSSSAVGIKESEVDDVFIVSPVDTKFSGKIGTGQKPKNTTHGWYTDSYAADAENIQPEGNTITISAVTAAVRLTNTLQILDKKFGISRTNLELDSYGSTVTEGHLTAKSMKELAKDTERATIRQTESTSDPRAMKGALNWIVTNLNKAADATLNANGTVTGGTLRPFTEGLFKDTVQGIFDNSTGEPDTVYTTSSLVRKFTEWSQTGTYRTMIEEGKLDSYVDVYSTEYEFSFRVRPHRIMPANTLFICDHSTWKKNILHSPSKKEVLFNADGKQFHIVEELTIEARSEICNGRITNVY